MACDREFVSSLNAGLHCREVNIQREENRWQADNDAKARELDKIGRQREEGTKTKNTRNRFEFSLFVLPLSTSSCGGLLLSFCIPLQSRHSLTFARTSCFLLSFSPIHCFLLALRVIFTGEGDQTESARRKENRQRQRERAKIERERNKGRDSMRGVSHMWAQGACVCVVIIACY